MTRKVRTGRKGAMTPPQHAPLKPPPIRTEQIIYFVDERKSLTKTSGRIGRVSAHGDVFTIKLFGNHIFDTVFAIYPKGRPAYWVMTDRTDPLVLFDVKFVSWDKEYSKRFQQFVLPI